MTKDEALKLAKVCIQASLEYKRGNATAVEAVEDIDAMLAQPAQEPVACIIDGDLYHHHEIDWEDLVYQGQGIELLYTTPPAAQPAQEPDDLTIAYMSGLHDGKKRERALWTLTKLGQEIEAQPAQEPVAYMSPNEDEFCTVEDAGTYIPKTWLALYTTPQQRPWVGLTDADMYEAMRPLCNSDRSAKFLLSVSKDEYQAIEAKLKEKNNAV